MQFIVCTLFGQSTDLLIGKFVSMYMYILLSYAAQWLSILTNQIETEQKKWFRE